MPNSIGPTGLTTATRSELLANITSALQTIYGSDINLDSDTPDGQAINIFIQSMLDVQDLLTNINAMFDPDQAVGVVLDFRVANNGIKRQGGTKTITNITIVTNGALNLTGLDAIISDPTATVFTVSDNAGNQFQLMTSQTIGGAGTYVYAFSSVNIGAVLTTPNTITNAITVVIGVVSINNPTTYTSLGLNEEPDSRLKIRRQQSTSIASQGYFDGLLAMLKNINGVTGAFVYENNTDTTDGDGTLSHTIWVIVQGGDSVSIANAIYEKRNAGCGMRGDQSLTITQVDGSPFVVYWDVVVPQDLYIKLHAHSINGADAIDAANIKTKLEVLLAPGVFDTVNINEVSTLVQEIDPNCLIVPTVGDGFSLTLMGSYTNILTPTSKNNQFAISSANISITVV